MPANLPQSSVPRLWPPSSELAGLSSLYWPFQTAFPLVVAGRMNRANMNDYETPERFNPHQGNQIQKSVPITVEECNCFVVQIRHFPRPRPIRPKRAARVGKSRTHRGKSSVSIWPLPAKRVKESVRNRLLLRICRGCSARRVLILFVPIGTHRL
jgi:hypothetical protein